MVVDAEVVETTRRQFGLQQPAAIAIRFFGIEWLRASDPLHLAVNLTRSTSRSIVSMRSRRSVSLVTISG